MQLGTVARMKEAVSFARPLLWLICKPWASLETIKVGIFHVVSSSGTNCRRLGSDSHRGFGGLVNSRDIACKSEPHGDRNSHKTSQSSPDQIDQGTLNQKVLTLLSPVHSSIPQPATPTSCLSITSRGTKEATFYHPILQALGSEPKV